MIKYQWEENQLKEVPTRMQSCICCYKTPEEIMMRELSSYRYILHEKLYDVEQWMKKLEPLQNEMVKSGLEKDMNDLLSVEQVNEILSKINSMRISIKP